MEALRACSPAAAPYCSAYLVGHKLVGRAAPVPIIWRMQVLACVVCPATVALHATV
jgi:hypothetical protein